MGWYTLQAGSGRSELNGKTPSWCQKNCLLWGKQPSHIKMGTRIVGAEVKRNTLTISGDFKDNQYSNF